MTDLSIEAPPSLLPQKHYCDITGLEVGNLSAYLNSELTILIGAIHRPSDRSAISRPKRLRLNQRFGMCHILLSFSLFDL